MGFSLSHQSKTNILDMIGNHFSDSVVDAVKDGKKLQGTGDNWDMKIRAHDMQSTHQNEDIHYFASNLIVERVPCQNVSATSPRKDIRTLPNSAFLLNNDEECKLREDFKVLVGRVLVSSIPSLAFLKSVIPEHIHHIYEEEMSKKSVNVPLPMQLKDEKKYSDVVDILDYYEDELENIYIKAGVVEKPADVSTVPADVSTVPADVSTVPADVSTVPADVSTVQSISTEGQSSLPNQLGAHFTKLDEK